ncbi:MAG: pyruvate dehydrogenase (acetyl-transferring) E1 component subunit alpha [Deltaproteobacteria bacterium]|nr:pyruvate dehydrogenase (acetyl-transferring) E1 component subunit alpha [Deltaproteobacteria bacterium]
MPIIEVNHFTTRRLQILDPSGVVDEQLMPDLGDEALVGLLCSMLRMRTFDEKALNLQRQGRIGTFGSLRGQEAAQAGLTLNLIDEDWLVPSIREQGVLEGRGLPMHLYYSFCKGDERASQIPDGLNATPQSIPIASQLLHAAGLGMALKLRNEEAAAVGFAGDGATSEGDFHEALNFAGVFGAQTLFYIQNNGWAISVPFSQQTAAETIAQKAFAYGFEGMQVDGNDVLAVYVASRDALDHVRSGKGPYLIEALTYRMESHTTADDHTRYRPAAEVEAWRARDPISRMRTFLSRQGLWDEQQEAELVAKVSAEVEAEVEALEAMPRPPATDIFDYMFAELPATLIEQRQQLIAESRNGK